MEVLQRGKLNTVYDNMSVTLFLDVFVSIFFILFYKFCVSYISHKVTKNQWVMQLFIVKHC